MAVDTRQDRLVSRPVITEYRLIKTESEKRAKESHEEALREAKHSMNELQYQWDEAVLQRAELVLRHRDAIERIRKAHHAIVEAQICSIEALSDIQGLKDRNAHIMARVEAEKSNVQQAADEANRTKLAGQRLSGDVQDILAREPEKRDLFSELCKDKDPESMQIEIEAEAAKLELIHAANPNVMREFEGRAAEITRLSKKMEGVNEKLDNLTQEIEEVMGKWEPRLEELVSKISDAFAYNFEQISCAGEVRVHKEENFDNWALDVMVRFRYVFSVCLILY